MAERSKAPDSRFTLPVDNRSSRILVLLWGRGFESHFWQKILFVVVYYTNHLHYDCIHLQFYYRHLMLFLVKLFETWALSEIDTTKVVNVITNIYSEKVIYLAPSVKYFRKWYVLLYVCSNNCKKEIAFQYICICKYVNK